MSRAMFAKDKKPRLCLGLIYRGKAACFKAQGVGKGDVDSGFFVGKRRRCCVPCLLGARSRGFVWEGRVGGGRYIGGESGAGVVLGLASLGFFHGGNDSFVMILSKRRFSNWQSQFHG